MLYYDYGECVSNWRCTLAAKTQGFGLGFTWALVMITTFWLVYLTVNKKATNGAVSREKQELVVIPEDTLPAGQSPTMPGAPDEGGGRHRNQTPAEMYRDCNGFVKRGSPAATAMKAKYKEIAEIQRQETLENDGVIPKKGRTAKLMNGVAKAKIEMCNNKPVIHGTKMPKCRCEASFGEERSTL